MNSRLLPIKRELFDKEILPIIVNKTKFSSNQLSGGRPPKIDHFICFCAMLKMISD